MSAPAGMTLRDWFAGQALAGLLAGDASFTVDAGTSAPLSAWTDYAEASYLHADAMLAERAKNEQEPAKPDEKDELLRAACAIAERGGEGTHWGRFAESIRKVGLNGITARTYRILPSDLEKPERITP